MPLNAMVARRSSHWRLPGVWKGFDFMGTGSVRVIGGTARGRRLRIPRGGRVRPTSDRIKESIFNILLGRPEGSTVLDLFAGSGNLGIEALSRGALQVVFVEKDRRCVRIIRENLYHLGFASRGEVLQSDSLAAISRLAEGLRKFPLIFFDPPYEEGWVCKSLNALADKGLLEKGGRIVAEHSFRERAPDQCGDLMLEDQRAYGKIRVSFYVQGDGGGS